MNRNENNELYELIRNICKGIRKHGITKVIGALKEINIITESEKNFSVIDFIEKLVCTKLGVPLDEMFNFTSRGEITIARKFCILLIRKYTDITDDELGNHYNRTRQVIHNTEKEYNLLREGKKNQFHIDFLAIYKELDIATQNFINEVEAKRLKNKKRKIK